METITNVLLKGYTLYSDLFLLLFFMQSCSGCIKMVNYHFMSFEMLTLPEHLLSPLVFIEVHVVLSFVSPYFML